MTFTAFPASIPQETITDQPEKVTPVAADELLIADSEDSASAKKIQIGNIPSSGGSPISSIVALASASIPTGYLACDGAAVSRATYADLFAEIGITHGEGDGSTTFNLPDYRGRFLRGLDGGAGNDPDAGSRTASGTSGNTGDNVGSYQADVYASHFHNVMANASGNANSWSSRAPAAYAFANGSDVTATGSPNANVGRSSLSGGNETRPKNINVNYAIKY